MFLKYPRAVYLVGYDGFRSHGNMCTLFEYADDMGSDFEDNKSSAEISFVK